nr:unnamed protein product [Callosobruchus analis]
MWSVNIYYQMSNRVLGKSIAAPLPPHKF